MAADALALCIARTSAVLVLSMQEKLVFIFFAASQYKKMIG